MSHSDRRRGGGGGNKRVQWRCSEEALVAEYVHCWQDTWTLRILKTHTFQHVCLFDNIIDIAV